MTELEKRACLTKQLRWSLCQSGLPPWWIVDVVWRNVDTDNAEEVVASLNDEHLLLLMRKLLESPFDSSADFLVSNPGDPRNASPQKAWEILHQQIERVAEARPDLARRSLEPPAYKLTNQRKALALRASTSLTIEEVADRLGLRPRRVRRWFKIDNRRRARISKFQSES